MRFKDEASIRGIRLNVWYNRKNYNQYFYFYKKSDYKISAIYFHPEEDENNYIFELVTYRDVNGSLEVEDFSNFSFDIEELIQNNEGFHFIIKTAFFEKIKIYNNALNKLRK